MAIGGLAFLEQFGHSSVYVTGGLEEIQTETLPDCVVRYLPIHRRQTGGHNFVHNRRQ